jgi:aminotransferase
LQKNPVTMDKPDYILEHILLTSRPLSSSSSGPGPPSYTCLAIAENKLSLDLVRPLLQSSSSDHHLADELLCLSACGYDDPRGDSGFRAALADFWSDQLLGDTSEASAPVSVCADHLACAAGLSAVLDLLLDILFRDTTKDGHRTVLAPAPYFPGYGSVVASPRLNGARLVGIPPPMGFFTDDFEPDDLIAPEALETGLRQAALSKPGSTTVLLLTNPTNPGGAVYSRSALQAAVAWARSHNIHTIVDEIYAGSVHSPDSDRPFVSTLVALNSKLLSNVHIMWGVSKDFGLAGWRVGALLTHNDAVRASFASLAHQCEASRAALTCLRHLLAQKEGVAQYLHLHRKRLHDVYRRTREALDQCGIASLPSRAGLFLLVDLTPFASTYAEETRLYNDLLHEEGINLTPGSCLGCPPGWFRLCFAYNTIDATLDAVTRLGSFLKRNLSSNDWAMMVAEEIPTKNSLYPAFVEELKKLARKGAAPTCLDVGCGDGKIGASVAELGFRVTGIDVNRAAVDLARARGIDAFVADACSLEQLGTEEFDCVLIQLVISIIGTHSDRRALLKSTVQKLRPGGLLLLSASGESAEINDGYARLYKLDRRATGEDRSYYSRDTKGRRLYQTHHFTEAELGTLLEEAGLVVRSFNVSMECSSRRPDQPANFFYVLAERA